MKRMKHFMYVKKKERTGTMLNNSPYESGHTINLRFEPLTRTYAELSKCMLDIKLVIAQYQYSILQSCISSSPVLLSIVIISALP